MWRIAIVVVGASLATIVGLRQETAGSWTMWLGVGIPYALLGAFAIYHLHSKELLRERFALQSGDVSVGAVIALLLLGGSWLTQTILTPPTSSLVGWLEQVNLQLGAPAAIRGNMAITAALVAIAALEEVVWRGLVLEEAIDRWGERRAPLIVTGLYTLCVAPSLFTLADPVAGYNPLLVVAAFGAGLCWAYAATRTRRLPPVIVSHMVFSYFQATWMRSGNGLTLPFSGG